MDIQNLPRLQQIKIWSGRIARLLGFIRFILFLGWPMIVFLAFAQSGTLHLSDESFQWGEVGWLFKVFVIGFFMVALFVMQRLAFFFRELMNRFSVGQVFSPESVALARWSLRFALAFYGLKLLMDLIVTIVIPSFEIDFGYAWDFLMAVIFFGFLYKLLWALEVGAELNEESQGTI